MLSNYTIKRMIPRLIIAVILVNISYYVCLLLVDVSNVLGFGSYAAITSMDGGLQPDTGTDGGWEDTMSNLLIGGLAVGVTGAALALTLSIPVVIMSLLALLMVAFILIARQALIILLIVLAPLAFVAYLLPNTENLYKKWQKMFITLLMVFPVIGLVFGASKLASTILGGVDSESPDVYEVMALAVLALPLFAIPLLLKGAMAASGTIGARLSNIQNSANRGLSAKAKKNRDDRQKYVSNVAKTRAFEAVGKEAEGGILGDSNSRRRKIFRRGVDGTIGRAKKREERYKYANIGKEALERGYFTSKVTDGESGEEYAKQVASGNEDIATLVTGYAEQEVRKEDQNDIEAEMSRMHQTSYDDLQKIMKGELGKATATRRAAAAAMIAKGGNGMEVQKALDSIDSFKLETGEDKKASRLIQEQILSNNKSAILGQSQGDRDALAKGSYSGQIAQKTNDRIEKKMSGEKLLDILPHDKILVGDMLNQKSVEDGGLSDVAMQSLLKSIHEAQTNDNLKGQIKPEDIKLHNKIIEKAKERGISVDIKTNETSDKTKGDTELRIDHNQPAPSEPSMVPPQNSRTSAPPNTGNYEQRQSGLYVPPTNREAPNPPTQPPSSS